MPSNRKRFFSNSFDLTFDCRENFGLIGSLIHIVEGVSFENEIIGLYDTSPTKTEITFFTDAFNPEIQVNCQLVFQGIYFPYTDQSECLVIRWLNYTDPKLLFPFLPRTGIEILLTTPGDINASTIGEISMATKHSFHTNLELFKSATDYEF